MINSINNTQTFGRKCAVILPASTDIPEMLNKIKNTKKTKDLYINFVEKNVKKLNWDEFTYVNSRKIDNSEMAEFIFDDGREYTSYQLPAILKYIFGEIRVVKL